jgi:AmiR/NasT family two-component response regulator
MLSDLSDPAEEFPPATVASQPKTLEEAWEVINDLNAALGRRLLIGQATGVIMVRNGLPADEAFNKLREFARRTNRKVHDLAREVVATREREAEDARSEGRRTL